MGGPGYSPGGLPGMAYSVAPALVDPDRSPPVCPWQTSFFQWPWHKRVLHRVVFRLVVGLVAFTGYWCLCILLVAVLVGCQKLEGTWPDASVRVCTCGV